MWVKGNRAKSRSESERFYGARTHMQKHAGREHLGRIQLKPELKQSCLENKAATGGERSREIAGQGDG